jgi:hypothetical protein
MTRRSPLWITALAVALGAAAWAPTGAGAQTGEEREQQEQDAVWDITIDTPDLVTTRDMRISGTAELELTRGSAGQVVVRVDLLPPLPPQCDHQHSAVVDVNRGQYAVEFPMACNGPYRIQVAVRTTLGTSAPATKDVGVEAKPPAPTRPFSDETDRSKVRWLPATDLDAHGWVLVVDGAPQELPLEVTEAAVPADGFTHSYALVQQRWGAGGPGSAPISSDPTPDVGAGPYNRPIDPIDPIDPTDPVDPPAGEPPPSGTGPAGSSSTAPPSTSGSTTPSRGTGAPSTTLPAGYTEELPYGVPDDAFEPGTDPASDGSSEDEETAAGTSPARGLVSTSEERAPGLVAPFALGLLLITVAVHIAWFLRRSRPPGGGQVTPH